MHLARRIDAALCCADDDGREVEILKQADSRFAGEGQLCGRFNFVDERNHARTRGDALQSALRMTDHPRDEFRRDRLAFDCSSQCAHQLDAMHVVIVKRLAEHIHAHHRHDQRGPVRDDRLVIGGGFEGPHARTVRFDQDRGHVGDRL